MFAAESQGKLKPGTARKWAHETKDMKKLPEHVKKAAFEAALFDELEKVSSRFTHIVTRNKNLLTSTGDPRFGFFTGRGGVNDTEVQSFRKMPEQRLRKEVLKHIRTVVTGLDLSHAKALATKGKPEIFTRRYPVSLINRIKRRFMSSKKREALLKQLYAKDDKAIKGVNRLIMTGVR